MERGKKYIHYCWFGDKKLPRLARRCIKSWKKYLPDYEIVCWNEKNLNIHECPFVEEAYKKKKWAFVADYARAKAIYEYGGIYLDTDMKIIKNVDFLLDKKDFIGVEDSGAVAVGVWGASKPGSKLSKELLDFYRAQNHFNDKNLYSLAIPVLVTNVLNRYGFNRQDNSVQVLKDGTYVYPRDYFYPLSYNYHDNAFSDNTCMIHYYDASWASKEERRTIWLIRKIGPKGAKTILSTIAKVKAMLIYYAKVFWRTLQIIAYPLRVLYKKFMKTNKKKYENATMEIKNKRGDFVVVVKDKWLGVGSASKSMFGDVTYIPEISKGDDFSDLVKSFINNKHIDMVIFSGFAEGWEKLIELLKKDRPDIVVKVFWHGSNAMHIEAFDWDRFSVMFGLLEKGIIQEIAFAKKSMYEQYKALGYNVAFLPNTFNVDQKIKNAKKKGKKEEDIAKVGIYFSGDRWVKNVYNQIAAASLIPNSEIDVVPISPRVAQFAKLLKININGEEDNIPRNDLLARIANDDVVLYATFVECAPILPLECLELGVPCVTGDNHHYWTGTPLEKYLVEPKIDNPVAIAKRAEKCIKNRDEIIKLYREWKKEYDKYCKAEVKKFLHC